MNIIEVHNPAIVRELEPFFIADGTYTKAYIAKELFEKMVARPDDVIVIVLLESGKLKGFAVAWTIAGMDYIFLNQAKYWPGCERMYAKLALQAIEKWAVDKHNIHKMRFETDRNPKAIERAWGFKIHSYIMNKVF